MSESEVTNVILYELSRGESSMNFKEGCLRLLDRILEKNSILAAYFLQNRDPLWTLLPCMSCIYCTHF